MISFFTVVAVIVILLNVVNYHAVTKKADQTLSYIEDFEKGFRTEGRFMPPPGERFMKMPNVEDNYMTRFFVVRFNEEGEASSFYMDYVAAVDEVNAVEYGIKALNGKGDRGYIKGYRYKKLSLGDSTVIVFLNVEKELQSMRLLWVLSALIPFVILLPVFILVVIFSKKAISPIAENIKRQKQFITDASHELKTPLTSIYTSVDVITAEHGDDEWTDNIKKQTERMSKLVSELVTLSRLDEDIPVPNKEKFSLSQAAWEITEVYTPEARAKGKHLEIDIEEDVNLFGDKSAVQQMLSVLLDNALRYSTPEGDIKFTLKKKHSKSEIVVYNTCDYEKPPEVDKLFDRFYRPDDSRSTLTGGTGVGLAIAKAVTEAHGGKIRAICPDGKSMTIKVNI
jgi:signal transduction histidine kinase